MLNFYLAAAARHMVTDNDSSTTCRSKFKDPSLKVHTKNERPSQKHGFHLITVWRFQTEKKIKNSRLGMKNKTKEKQDPIGKNWTWAI